MLRTGLAAVNAASGAVDLTFDNQLAGGIGVNGQLGVPQLKLTHDESKLLVVHTGRQIDGQDRYGMGIIDTATKELLPWRSQLWDTNLGRVGGVTRIYGGDIAPDDSYFVVASGSGGDAPPISDTAIAYPLNAASLQDSDVQPLWIARHFDSIYSVAITELAVYVGGHFGFIESPTVRRPVARPRQRRLRHRSGPGRLRPRRPGRPPRPHRGDLPDDRQGARVVLRSPTPSRATRPWRPPRAACSSAATACSRAASAPGASAFYDFNTVPFPAPAPDTTITTPIEGRVVANNAPFEITGTARVATGTVGRVQVQIQDRDSGQYLQDNGTAFTHVRHRQQQPERHAGPGTGTTRTGRSRPPSPPTATCGSSRRRSPRATGGTGDSTKAKKWFESFSTEDQTPTTSITGPSGSSRPRPRSR